MAHEILTTVVGSYPVPQWLYSAQKGEQALADALSVVLRTQERAGIDVISDGELSRFDPSHPETNGMIDSFIAPLEGISTALSRSELEAFRAVQGMAFRRKPAGVVRSRLGEGSLYLVGDFLRVRRLTDRPLKFTVTCPYMLAKTLLDDHYRDLERLVMDLAEILRLQVEKIEADVLQVDEANLTGHPEDWRLVAQAVNHIFSTSPAPRKGVHLCFGNYGGQTIQKGTWKELLAFFNALTADHLLLEFARRGYDELEYLRDLKEGISLGAGVVDIKDNQIESAETVAERIARSMSTLGAGRIRWVHPDCGLWMLPRPVADGKMKALVEGRNLVEGKSR